jgi:hypothetical protein
LRSFLAKNGGGVWPDRNQKLNGFDPKDYLRQMLTAIADHPAKRIDTLLLGNMDGIRKQLDQRKAA